MYYVFMYLLMLFVISNNDYNINYYIMRHFIKKRILKKNWDRDLQFLKSFIGNLCSTKV